MCLSVRLYSFSKTTLKNGIVDLCRARAVFSVGARFSTKISGAQIKQYTASL